MSVTIYGASDDLIEIEGDIREEFNPPYDEEAVLAFSDGTVLRMKYGDSGVWRIAPVFLSTEGPLRGGLEIVQAPENDETNYSDRATIKASIFWVVMGTQIAMVKT